MARHFLNSLPQLHGQSSIFKSLFNSFAAQIRRAYSSTTSEGNDEDNGVRVEMVGSTPVVVVADAEEMVDVLDIEDLEGTKQEKYKYQHTKSESFRTKHRFDEYPYYIERDWWKEGKRMTFWATWRQLADVRRRREFNEFGPDRMRYKAMKTNDILPRAIIDEFQEKMNQMPKGAHPNNIQNLCMFTGARRGKFKRFRVNRHIFRQLADSGKLAGVKKAYW